MAHRYLKNFWTAGLDIRFEVLTVATILRVLIFSIMTPYGLVGAVIISEVDTTSIFRSYEDESDMFLWNRNIQLVENMSWISKRQGAKKKVTFDFVISMLSVFCEVETKLLNIFWRSFMLRGIRGTGNALFVVSSQAFPWIWCDVKVTILLNSIKRP